MAKSDLHSHGDSPSRSLKIGFVLDDSLDGTDGVQQYVLTVGEWMRKQGHVVHYLVSATKRQDVLNIHSLSRNWGVRFNGNRMHIPLPAPMTHIRNVLDQEQFDVLHVQTPFSPFLAGRIISAAKPETAVIGTFHVVPNSRIADLGSSLLAWWCRKSLRRFDAMLSVSPPAAAFARRTFHIDSEVVPNAVWFKSFHEAKPFSSSDPRLNILFLGRLVPRKGCHLLLEAIALLNNDSSVPQFRVTICGKGPLAESLKRFVEDNGLGSVVEFVGFVSEEDKPRYYASADTTVFPSTGGESFGIVLVEAMSSGRAVVLGGNNVGYRSVLESCPGDVLFNPHNIAALAKRLKVLLGDAPQRQHIADWQQWRAQSFDVERVGLNILRIYTSVLRRRNVR